MRPLDSLLSSLGSPEFNGENYYPERGLLSAVLERAYRDLFSTHYESFKSAVLWFRKYKPTQSHISFDDCITFLELGALQVEFILETVQKYEYLIGSSKLFKQERQSGVVMRRGKSKRICR